MPQQLVRAAIYARISEDTTGEGAGVKRQVAACRELAEGRGWSIVAECTDNDVSALKGRSRPGYQQIVDLVRAGSINYVVVWQTSRLLRNRRERAEAIELFGKQRVGIITVKGQDLDLSTAYGRGMAGMLGEFDTMESEVKSERVAAAAADRAARGKPNGALGYGWTKDDSGEYVIHPDEAPVVRDIVRRLAAGESLLGVTSDLNSRGVPAPAASSWGKTSVKKVALRPSNAALRIHHRGRATEQVFEGTWPALVSVADWKRVSTVLSAPDRRTNAAARPGARKHLLTWGIGVCGVCGGKLRVGVKGNQRYGAKKHLYLCEAKGCVGRDEASVDALVARVVVERVARGDAQKLLEDSGERSTEAEQLAADLRARLADAADRFADGTVTGEQLTRINTALLPQLEELESQIGRAATVDARTLADLAGPTADAKWRAMSISQQRTLLAGLGLTVRIMPATRRGPGFDANSVEIAWAAGLSGSA